MLLGDYQAEDFQNLDCRLDPDDICTSRRSSYRLLGIYSHYIECFADVLRFNPAVVS
jgi:hypothetical protein